MLNETKLNAIYLEQLTVILAYEQVQQKRNCRGGWISICIRDSIKFNEIEDMPMSDLELVCLEIELSF